MGDLHLVSMESWVSPHLFHDTNKPPVEKNKLSLVEVASGEVWRKNNQPYLTPEILLYFQTQHTHTHIKSRKKIIKKVKSMCPNCLFPGNHKNVFKYLNLKSYKKGVRQWRSSNTKYDSLWSTVVAFQKLWLPQVLPLHLMLAKLCSSSFN